MAYVEFIIMKTFFFIQVYVLVNFLDDIKYTYY